MEVRGGRGAGWKFRGLRSWAWLAPLLQTPASAPTGQERMETLRLEAECKGQARPILTPGQPWEERPRGWKKTVISSTLFCHLLGHLSERLERDNCVSDLGDSSVTVPH